MTNLENFIGKAILELVSAKVNVHLVYSDKVSSNEDDPDPCAAFFEINPFTIKVATKYKNDDIWMKEFLHEYCHYKQTIEKDPTVRRFNFVKDGKDANTIINSWIKGKGTSRELLEKCVRLVQAMELDCEQRVVKLIIDNDLELNVDKYVSCANAYILFYNVMLDERKWYNKSPEFIETITNTVPSQFLDTYSDNNLNLFTDWYLKYKNLVKQKCF